MTNSPKVPMVCRLVDSQSLRHQSVRDLAAEDAERLGRLLYHAYVDTVDYEGESEADAIAEVRKTFAGAYGEMIWPASQVFECDGELRSVSVITAWQGRPLLTFAATHPAWKNQGLARACVLSSMNVLCQAGHTELRLFVSRGNAPALALYRKLGFDAPRDADTE